MNRYIMVAFHVPWLRLPQVDCNNIIYSIIAHSADVASGKVYYGSGKKERTNGKKNDVTASVLTHISIIIYYIARIMITR